MVEALKEKLVQYDFKLWMHYDVTITRLHHPSSFYVRPISVTEEEVHLVEIRGAPMAKEDISKNKLVVYNSMTARKYIRGQVDRVITWKNKTTYVIKAIDYGYYDTWVPASAIHHPGGDITIRPLVNECKLANCFSVGTMWNREALQAVKRVTEEPRVTIHVQSIKLKDKAYMVDIITKESNINVVTWLVDNKLATPNITGEYAFLEPYTTMKEYAVTDLMDGEEFDVIIVRYVSNSEFYVAKEEEYTNYLNNREEFSSYCEQQPILPEKEFLRGRSVGYKCELDDDFFERAYIVAFAKEHKATIQLIDTGEKVEVINRELRRVDPELIRQVPAAALFCSTDQQHCKFTLRTGVRCTIKIESAGDDFFIAHEISVKCLKDSN